MNDRTAAFHGSVVNALQQRRARLLTEMRADLAALELTLETFTTTGIYEAGAFPLRLRWLADLARADEAWQRYAAPEDLLKLRTQLLLFLEKVEDGGPLEGLLAGAEAAVERMLRADPSAPERETTVERCRAEIEEGVSAARRAIIPIEHARQ